MKCQSSPKESFADHCTKHIQIIITSYKLTIIYYALCTISKAFKRIGNDRTAKYLEFLLKI